MTENEPAELPVPITPVQNQPPPAVPPMPPWSAPAAPVWPSAGDATVDLAVSGTTVTLDNGDVGIAGSMSPGGLAVTVTVPAAELLSNLAPAGVSELRVSTSSQSAAAALGIKGVVFVVANAGSAVEGSAPVTVAVDYSRFRNAYGGNYGDRLRLVKLPACAITTPAVPECRIQSAADDERNKRDTTTVSAVVDLGEASIEAGELGAAVMAIAAGASSQTGDWAATPISESTSWQAGGSSGDFSFAVPINVPPAPGGLVPKISLGYSSGSVDGLTKSKNAQASWVGEGWDYHPGFVERTYRPCRDDGHSSNRGDLCWVSVSPLTLVLDGKSTRLIDAGAAGWKTEDDNDGWKVERLTGVDNAARGGEAFKVTTRDGTQYFFGSKRPDQYGGVMQVEVFGNNAGEPCNHPNGFWYSHCTMPYRWNLDRVVDVHGNVIDLEWWNHRGSYGGNGGADVFPYDIYGRLTNIYYGANPTAGSAQHTGRVEFYGRFRCFDTEAACNADRSKYADVPWDQYCAENASSCGNTSPTFFNIYRLGNINTYVWSSAGTWGSVVNQWTTTHRFPANRDGTSPSLWLDNIWQPGHTNPITASGIEMANRVDYGTGKPETTHWRIYMINTGVGGTVNVTYSPPDCSSGSLPAQADNNSRRCFPQNNTGTVSWWHKYVVTDVHLGEHVGGGPSERWHYDYKTDWSSTNALWKHDQAWHTPPQYRTWPRWAGYPTVVTTHSDHSGSGPKLITETLYFRGMKGDWTAAGGAGARQAHLDDNWVHVRPDEEALAGRPARTLTWDGPANPGWSNWTAATKHYYSITTTGSLYVTPPNPSIYATRVRETETVHQTVMAGPTYRVAQTLRTFEPTYGLVTTVTENEDTSITTDDRCVVTEYAAANVDKWLVGLPKQTWTTTCAANPAAVDVLAATRTTYDNVAFGAAPTRGLVTRTQAVKAVTTYPPSTADFHQTARFIHDAYGRVADSYDPLDRQTTTIYSPAVGGPVSSVTTRGPSIAGQRWDTVTTLDTRFGSPTKVVDVNGKVTRAEYDSVGRLTKVWKNHRAPTGTTGITPDAQYTYYSGAPTAVSTKALGPDGQQIESFEIYDGLLRPRQTQIPSGNGAGRAVAETLYNGIGLADKTSTYYATGTPAAAIVGAADKDIKVQQRLVYDNLGRVTRQQQWAGDATTATMLWETLIGYDGDKSTTVTPPAGGTATTTFTNARGQAEELRQHLGGTPAGAVDTTTRYKYDRLGRVIEVKDSADNTWRYRYDLLGRKIETVDPDAGTSTSIHDNAGQITSTTDGRSQGLFYTYDNLGRKTELRHGSTLRAAWTYDTIAKGQLTSSTRYEAGKAYTQSIDSYDDAYRPGSSTYRIPGFGASGGILNYTIGSTYKVNGDIGTETLPGVGGLPAEILTHGYNGLGMYKRLTTNHSQGTYIDGTEYFFDGLVYRQFLGVAPVRTRIETNYAAPGRRVSNQLLHIERSLDTYGTSRFGNHYGYDAAGNITSIQGTRDGVVDQQECFRHDHLRRLAEAWTQTSSACTTPQRTGVDPYWRRWTFDKLGNRRTQVDKDPTAGDTTWTYAVGTAEGVKPHQLRAVSAVGPKADATRSFTYDVAGNTRTRTTPTGGTQTLMWDPEGHVASLEEGGVTTTYVYDTGGNRLIATTPSKTNLYLPDGTELEKRGTADPLGTRIYGGVAVRDTTGLRWTIPDHHGTTTAQIDPATQVIDRRRNMPYGEPRGPQATGWKGTKGYVGGTADDTGLTHLGAREYDPTVGRFLSVDSVMDLDDPQHWNAYSYANASPVTASDPSGLKPMFDDYLDLKGWLATQKQVPPRNKCLGNSASCREGGGAGPRVTTILGHHKIVAPSAEELQAALDASWAVTQAKFEKHGAHDCLAGAKYSGMDCGSVSYYWQGDTLCAAHPDWCTRYQDNHPVDSMELDGYSGKGGPAWVELGAGVAVAGASVAVLREAVWQHILTEDRFGRMPERMSGFKIWGNKGMVGEVFSRNVLFLDAEVKGAAPLHHLLRAMEAEAKAAGATKISITGNAVINRGFTPVVARRYGYTFTQINSGTFHITRTLP